MDEKHQLFDEQFLEPLRVKLKIVVEVKWKQLTNKALRFNRKYHFYTIQIYLLELFCKLNGPCCGLSKGFGLEDDNGDDGLLFPKIQAITVCKLHSTKSNLIFYSKTFVHIQVYLL